VREIVDFASGWMIVGGCVVVVVFGLVVGDILRTVVVVVVVATITGSATTIPQVEHGWRVCGWSDGDAIFHRHLMMDVIVRVALLAAQVVVGPIRPWVMVQMMLARVARVVIGPGRVETRLAGRGQSTRFHHSEFLIIRLTIIQKLKKNLQKTKMSGVRFSPINRK
jgi:hypothetical protein